MLQLRKTLSLIFAVLLLVQPVFAETVNTAPPTVPPEPDLISAVYSMEELPSNWSPLSPATTERTWLRNQTTTPVYKLSADGSWLPVLAAELPEDVTKKYTGSYGIPKDATGGYAYRIQLNPEARWDDGLLITADDYIFSIGKLLEDEDHRENWTFLANANSVLSAEKQPGNTFTSLRELGLSGVRDALAKGYTDLYIDTSGFWGLDEGWKSISDRTRLEDRAMPGGMDERFVSPAYLYLRYLADGAENSRFQSRFIGIRNHFGNIMTMQNLGAVKTGNFELVLISGTPMAPSTVMQKLENLFLFRKSCWGKDFATSPDTYFGYGPYHIIFSDASQIILEPNPYWWGEPVSSDFDRIICRGKD